MKKLKIFLFTILFCFSSSFAFSQRTVLNETALFSELNAAFKTKAYPATVEYAVKLEENFPKSVFMPQILVCHGESLFYLSRYDEAINILESASSYSEGDAELYARSNYFLGRSYAAKEEYSDALYAFYDVLHKGLPSSREAARYYYLSVLYSAKTYVITEYFDRAEPLLENAAASGDFYSTQEYVEVVSQLFNCYLKTEKYTKLTVLYESLLERKDFFTEREWGLLSLDAGTAYEKLGHYKKAYGIYCEILVKEDSELASIALKKAYNVSSGHAKEIGGEPGSILKDAGSSLENYDSLLEEMWTRLAVDAFNAGDRKKAGEYLQKAKSGESHNYSLLIGLYEAELNPSKAIEILDEYSKNQTELTADYLAEYTKWYAVSGAWSEAIKYGSKALSKMQKNDSGRPELVYWYALSLYATNDFESSYTALKSVSLSSSNVEYNSVMFRSLVLFARVLSKRGNESAALRIYDDLATHATLSEDERVDYAMLLFKEGYLNSAYKQASLVNTPKANYVAALSAFNKKDWSNAEKLFSRYLSSGQKDYAPYASFYCGYSQYKNGQDKASYNTLSDFINRYPSSALVWNACITSSNAALQQGNFQNAIEKANQAVEFSKDEDEKQSSLILLSSIYVDSKQYDNAIKVLKESASRKDSYGARARYYTAQVYAKQGNLSYSDKLYRELGDLFPQEPLADEATYRRGEMYYIASEYSQAVPRFVDYQKKFPKGQFVEASYFYIADSYTNLGQISRAMMQYTVLIEAFPNGTYTYNARKNLVSLYRGQGEYEKALSEARKILSDYEEEASKDDIPLQISELKQLVSGMDEKLVELYSEYERAGKSSTQDGRIIGTEIAEKLYDSPQTQKDAYILASELFPLQSDEKNSSRESSYGARTAVIIAQYKRQLNENKAAADRYLDASRLARQGGEGTVAQRALYGAAEAFDAAGLYADALLVVENMQELYPTGPYTLKAKKLVQSYKK